ncbi:MAG TPA: flagellin [Acidobacteriaceae bacterium]|jgi:flagellin|nr:flagellin [Acidobacteriaceae bacterium]
MPLGVLNNISAIYAENNLNQTQSSLQNVLTQLSSGSRINSGADDPAGLSIANGLAANSAALTQSSSNASEGVGFLQVADGALSQVTSLLTSAVTLATEAGGGTLSSSQMSAANQEYQDILSQIGTIGSTTEYNGIQVFSGDQTTSALSWATGSGAASGSAAVTAAAVASSNIAGGGTTTGTAPALAASTYDTPADISWTGDGTTTLTATIAEGTQLSGTVNFVPTVAGDPGTAISVDLSQANLADLTSSDSTKRSTAAGQLAHDLNENATTAGGTDYTVSDNGTSIVIGLGADAGSSKDNITALAAPTTGNTGSMAEPTGFTMTVTDGDSLSGSLSVAAAGDSNSPYSIDLSGVTTANLVSTVELGLGGTQAGDGTITANPDYDVTYSSGTLAVSLTTQATGTDSMTSLSATGTSLAETAPTAASLTFTNGDTVNGQFTITPTTNGTAGSAITVNLAGVSTANLVDTVNTALGSAAADYTVGYTSGTGVLKIALNSQAGTDGVNSFAIANGSGNEALSQGTAPAQSAIAATNTLMGSFSITPTGSSTTPINVSLTGATPATLVNTITSALGSSSVDYSVSYTAGELSIGLTSAGVAAGLTGFTVAEPTTGGAASQETPVSGGVNIYTGDGTSTGSKNYNVTVGPLSDAAVGSSASNSNMGLDVTATVGGVTGTGGVLSGAGQGTSLSGTVLTTQADAEAALQTVDDAINAVAYQRGQVGANINTLNAASNIASSQQTNITSAENTITATDYASATSNMSKYEILTQTGISALAQANSTQQMVTKLLQ